MPSKSRIKVTQSTGNVFRDLGFSGDEAEYLKLRAELMVNLQKVLTARGLKQAEAAALLGVTQPRVSDLMRGRIDLFSIDTLIDMSARLGIRVKLVLHPRFDAARTLVDIARYRATGSISVARLRYARAFSLSLRAHVQMCGIARITKPHASRLSGALR